MPAGSLLDRLSDEDRRSVTQIAVRRRYRKDDSVFHAGDVGDTLHLITKGRVAIQVVTPAGDVATLAILGSGETFGELALVREDATRSATVVALEALETLTIRRVDVERLRATSPAMERFLVEVLAAQVIRLTELLIEAHFVSAEKRVVRRLAAVANRYIGEDGAVCVPLTQEELAGLAGSTRPTANRVLRGLAADGIVRLSRSRIEVLELAALERRAR
jgi:CRP-like cAMP-binding protein